MKYKKGSSTSWKPRVKTEVSYFASMYLNWYGGRNLKLIQEL